MREEIIMAGFGGQGIMLMGKLLAFAGMKEGYEVSWLPSYGPEMRGRTANCTVIISTEKIASPLSYRPDTLIAMNYPSLHKFLSRVKKNGSIYYNSSLIQNKVDAEDKNLNEIPVNELAADIGNDKVGNMVILGSYLAKRRFISLDAVKESLKEIISEKWQDLIELNKRALEKGAEYINKIRP